MPGMCARCRSEQVDATHIRWTCDNDRCGNYAGGIDPSFTLHPLYAEMFQERERGRQWAYVEMREERERFQAERDAALALLRKARAPLAHWIHHDEGLFGLPRAEDVALLAEIDALLSKETP